MTTDQLTFDKPVDRHRAITPPHQDQDMPGLDAELQPRADRGEQSYRGSEHLVDCATTKAAMNAFTKGLAKQCAPDGIRVNAVAPGPIWTPLQVVEGQPKGALPEFGLGTPLGRAGMPVELAPAYVFLASPESSYVVGETLNVNGGLDSP